MRLIYFLMMIVITATACKKSGSDQTYSDFSTYGPFAGVWIEVSGLKDTLNFNISQNMLEQVPWRPPSNAGIFIMGSEKYKSADGSDKSPAGLYSYYRQSDSLYLYNFYSSASKYTGFRFQLSDDKTSLSIDRFFDRPGLGDVVRFQRIR